MNRLEQTRQESIRVWADAQRKALHEAVRNTPVAPPAVAAAASGTGSGGSFSGNTCTLVPITWPTEETDFDEYVINFEVPITNVSKLTSSFTSDANGHTHNEYSVNISIDLYDADKEAWVNVWGRQLSQNGSLETEYFIKDTVDTSFITIGTVTALKVWSSPELGNTFHDWGDNTTDKFILHSECTNACSTKLFLHGEVNWEGQGGSSDFDNFIIEFEPINNVRQLTSLFPDRFNSEDGNDSAIAHIHNEFETAKLSIDLWDSLNENWINVWNYQLVNTFHPDEDLYSYVIGESISVCFPNIEEITKLKVYVDNPSNYTYHNWFGDDAFKFYG